MSGLQEAESSMVSRDIHGRLHSPRQRLQLLKPVSEEEIPTLSHNCNVRRCHKFGRYVVVQERVSDLDDYRKGCIKRQTFVALTALKNLSDYKLKLLKINTPYFEEKTRYDNTQVQDVMYTCTIASLLLNYETNFLLEKGWKWKLLPVLVNKCITERQEMEKIALGKIENCRLLNAEMVLELARKREILDKNENLSLQLASKNCSADVLLHTWCISSMVASRNVDLIEIQGSESSCE